MSSRHRLLPAAVATTLMLAACGGSTSGTTADAPAQTEPSSETASSAPAVEPGETGGFGVDLGSQPRPVLGDPDAPVTLIEFSDFQCPFCERFAEEIEPELVAEYVDSGQVRIVWHDFPAKGRDSVAAAVAGRAALRQDAFWEYHAELFARKGSIGYSNEELTALAGELGLDVDRFAADLEDPRLEQRVLDDFNRGRRVGVRGTPSFLVGGEPLIGAQPLSAFTEAIEAQLAAGS